MFSSNFHQKFIYCEKLGTTHWLLPCKEKENNVWQLIWTFSLIWVALWGRPWQHIPVLLPGKSHGQRSLVGWSPWGCSESDTTERLHFHFSLSWIGEGNGDPLQCSCLENPRGRGAWWAAIYGIAQSQTWLKRFSSSSSSMNHSHSKVIFFPSEDIRQFLETCVVVTIRRVGFCQHLMGGSQGCC